MEHLHPKFKTIHIQGHPVKVKYSAVSNTDTLRAIQSIILSETGDLQLFAKKSDINKKFLYTEIQRNKMSQTIFLCI